MNKIVMTGAFAMILLLVPISKGTAAGTVRIFTLDTCPQVVSVNRVFIREAPVRAKALPGKTVIRQRTVIRNR